LTDGLPPVLHLARGRQWRGGERQVLLTAIELAKLGIEQRVITRRGGRVDRELRSAGVDVRPVGWRVAPSPGAFVAAGREAAARPFILHAHDAHALTVAVLVGRVVGRRVVATKRTEFPLKRHSLWRGADRVIAVSHAARRALERGGVPAERIDIVPPGIDLAATRAARLRPRPIRRELGLADTATLAVNVAALTREKDHATLLRAAALVAPASPDLHWIIAGDGPLRGRLEGLARDLGIAARIHFLGWLDEPSPVIAAADLFVLTSNSEGSATVLLDAMALGVPIVATAAGGIPEAVGAAALLAPIGDAHAVAAAVRRVHVDPTCRASLLEAARGTVAERTAAGMARGVVAVYRSVVLRH
jgi:glycosyltransferase involved in cell wall biosynthesis